MQTTNPELIELIKELPQRRGDKRKEVIRSIIARLLAERGEITSPMLNAVLSNSKRLQASLSRTVREILKQGIAEGLIKEYTLLQTRCALYNKPLFSYDYGSYHHLMVRWRTGAIKGCVTNSPVSMGLRKHTSPSRSYVSA